MERTSALSDPPGSRASSSIRLRGGVFEHDKPHSWNSSSAIVVGKRSGRPPDILRYGPNRERRLKFDDGPSILYRVPSRTGSTVASRRLGKPSRRGGSVRPRTFYRRGFASRSSPLGRRCPERLGRRDHAIGERVRHRTLGGLSGDVEKLLLLGRPALRRRDDPAAVVQDPVER
jgi:hypothetical protein